MAISQTKFLSLKTVLLDASLRLCVAESCTGGGFAKCCTDLPGSSAWFEGGFVVYSNLAKQKMLDVPAAVLASHGSVSQETVLAMAAGALQKLPTADLSVAVSGIAGPDGGTVEKPVGLVWFAWQLRGHKGQSQVRQFEGTRAEIREQAIQTMLEGTLRFLAKQ